MQWASVQADRIFAKLQAEFAIETERTVQELWAVICHELVHGPRRPDGHWAKRSRWREDLSEVIAQKLREVASFERRCIASGHSSFWGQS